MSVDNASHGRHIGMLKRELSSVEYELRGAVRKLIDENDRRYPRPKHVEVLTAAIERHKQKREILKNRLAETEYTLQPAAF